MSIRAIAKDLYRARQKVDAKQKELEAASVGEQPAVQIELREAEKELQMLQRMLDGEKQSGSFRKRMGNTFGKG